MIQRLLSLLVASTLTATVAAQSFLDPGVVWVMDTRVDPRLPLTVASYFRLGADSTVGGVAYRIVERDDDQGRDYRATDILLRADTRGRVYFRHGDRDGLAYDFSLAVGDTIRPLNPLFPVSPCVSRVVATGDTTFADGVRRRTYRVADAGASGAPATIVEGIGSLRDGLFGRLCLTDVATELLCFLSADGTSLLSSGRCIYVGVEDARPARPGEVTPNPMSEFVALDFPELDQAAGFELFDVRGARLAGGRLTGGRTLIDTQALLPGAYIVMVTGDSGERIAARVMKL